MRQCPCGEQFPSYIRINGKRHSLRGRFKCLKCMPFGSSPYSHDGLGEEHKKLRLAAKQRRHYARTKVLGVKSRAERIRKERKALAVKLLGGGCSHCGYSTCMRNLVFHHLKDKEFDLTNTSFQYSWTRIIPEIAKCSLICHNCHGEVHEGLWIIDQPCSVEPLLYLIQPV